MGLYKPKKRIDLECEGYCLDLTIKNNAYMDGLFSVQAEFMIEISPEKLQELASVMAKVEKSKDEAYKDGAKGYLNDKWRLKLEFLGHEEEEEEEK